MQRRRDTRGEFSGEPVPDDVLERVLGAAHAAPSVGMSQPWDFVLVRDEATRAAFRDHVACERDTFAATLDGERARTFARIKVEGILESGLGIVVGYDPDRGGPAVLGRHAIADAGLYSVCLAIQNLWLAATAEGLGVGWVSFYREEFLRGPGVPSRPRAAGRLALCRSGDFRARRTRPGAVGVATPVAAGVGGARRSGTARQPPHHDAPARQRGDGTVVRTAGSGRSRRAAIKYVENIGRAPSPLLDWFIDDIYSLTVVGSRPSVNVKE